MISNNFNAYSFSTLFKSRKYKYFLLDVELSSIEQIICFYDLMTQHKDIMVRKFKCDPTEETVDIVDNIVKLIRNSSYYKHNPEEFYDNILIGISGGKSVIKEISFITKYITLNKYKPSKDQEIGHLILPNKAITWNFNFKAHIVDLDIKLLEELMSYEDKTETFTQSVKGLVISCTLEEAENAIAIFEDVKLVFKNLENIDIKLTGMPKDQYHHVFEIIRSFLLLYNCQSVEYSPISKQFDYTLTVKNKDLNVLLNLKSDYNIEKGKLTMFKPIDYIKITKNRYLEESDLKQFFYHAGAVEGYYFTFPTLSIKNLEILSTSFNSQIPIPRESITLNTKAVKSNTMQILTDYLTHLPPSLGKPFFAHYFVIVVN